MLESSSSREVAAWKSFGSVRVFCDNGSTGREVQPRRDRRTRARGRGTSRWRDAGARPGYAIHPGVHQGSPAPDTVAAAQLLPDCKQTRARAQVQESEALMKVWCSSRMDLMPCHVSIWFNPPAGLSRDTVSHEPENKMGRQPLGLRPAASQ